MAEQIPGIAMPALDGHDDPVERAYYRYAALYEPPTDAQAIYALFRWAWRDGYRQCGKDTSAIGETIPVFRRFIELAEPE